MGIGTKRIAVDRVRGQIRLPRPYRKKRGEQEHKYQRDQHVTDLLFSLQEGYKFRHNQFLFFDRNRRFSFSGDSILHRSAAFDGVFRNRTRASLRATETDQRVRSA